MVPCNVDETVQIPAFEAGYVVYVETEAKLFDQNTGKKLSSPKKEKYSIVNFEKHERLGFFKGKTVKILNDPRIDREMDYHIKKQKENGSGETKTD